MMIEKLVPEYCQSLRMLLKIANSTTFHFADRHASTKSSLHTIHFSRVTAADKLSQSQFQRLNQNSGIGVKTYFRPRAGFRSRSRFRYSLLSNPIMASSTDSRDSSNSHSSSSVLHAESPLYQSHNKETYDYFLVLDFEATCDNKSQPKPQEIIEFPVLKVNASTCEVESVFHQYVLPQYHPHLTPFCTELTGIVQDMVQGQPHLPEVLQNFHQWMVTEKLLEPACNFIFVTCGDWDLKIMLPKQCAFLDINPAKYFRKWINIKRSFAEMTGEFPKGMMPMLQKLNIKHIGRHHSGIDDCHNIANILTTMIRQGFVFKQTGRLEV